MSTHTGYMGLQHQKVELLGSMVCVLGTEYPEHCHGRLYVIASNTGRGSPTDGEEAKIITPATLR